MTCKDGRFNTGNKLCSNDLRDLNDNSIIVDGYVNSQELYIEDRLGVERLTLAGIQNKSDKQHDDIQERADAQNTAITDRADSTISNFEGEIDAIIKDAGGVEVVGEFGDSIEDVISQKKISEHLGQDSEGNTVIKSGSEVFTLPKNGGSLVSNRDSITFNVPRDFETLQQAFDSALMFHNTSVEIIISSGSEPKSGIKAVNVDARNITISAEDDVVLLGVGFGKSVAFIEADNSIAPTLNTFVDGNNGEAGFCYKIHNNSKGKVNKGKGGVNFWQDGLAVRYGSTVVATDSIFNYNALNGNTSSNIHAVASTVVADGAQATHSSHYGVQATSGGVVSFREGVATDNATLNIRARDGGYVDAENAKLNNSRTGIRAFYSGKVDARGAEINNCSEFGVSATFGSYVSITDSSIAGSKGYALYCSANSSISSNSSKISDTSGADAVLCGEGSTISLTSSVIKKSRLRSLLSRDGGGITASGVTIEESGGVQVTAENGGIVNISKCSVINGGSFGIVAHTGGDINANNGVITGHTSRSVYSYSGGHINVVGTDCRLASDKDTTGINGDIVCLTGSTIVANSAKGGVNKQINALNENGIIYKDA